MPSCKNVLDALSEYIDGRLPDTQRQAIDSHLAQCSKCLAIFQEVKSVKETLSKMPRIRTGPYFQAVLTSRLNRTIQNSQGANQALSFFSGLRARAVWATAAVLILGIIFIKPDLLPFQKSDLLSSALNQKAVGSAETVETGSIRQNKKNSANLRKQSDQNLSSRQISESGQTQVSLLQRKKNAIIYF